jgi:hypothetical protein
MSVFSDAFGPAVHKFLNSIRINCFRWALSHLAQHFSINDLHFRHNFINTVSSVVPDTLIDFLLNLKQYYNRWYAPLTLHCTHFSTSSHSLDIHFIRFHKNHESYVPGHHCSSNAAKLIKRIAILPPPKRQ